MNGAEIVQEFIFDDGWSGTNFERPNFQRMIDDVESGKVNCIITKDLSRRFSWEQAFSQFWF